MKISIRPIQTVGRANSSTHPTPRPLLQALAFVLLTSVAVVAGAGGNRESGSDGSITAGDATGAMTNAEIDYLEIAALMLRDGNYQRAESALKQVDLTADSIDRVRYFTLRGLLAMYLSDHAGAIDSFERAISEGQRDPLINAYLGQAYFAIGDYAQAVATISQLTNFYQFPELLGVKSQSQWKLSDTAGAFETIEQAIELFPEEPMFLRQRIFYLIELDLTQAAAEASDEFLARSEGDPDAYLTIGESLRRAGHYEDAVTTLEMAKIAYPQHEQIRLALAQAYLDSGKPHTAAALVEEAAAFNSAYTRDAAELYRKAKRYSKALYLNSLVTDQEEKAGQRFNILIEMERYEEALALEPRLERLGLLEDDGYLYALAYVHFSAGHYQKAADYTNRIAGSDYFRQATKLRSAIESAKKQDIQYF